jgi:hypothetical protein
VPPVTANRSPVRIAPGFFLHASCGISTARLEKRGALA